MDEAKDLWRNFTASMLLMLGEIDTVVVVVVSGAYTGFLLSLELASLLECRRGPVHTLGKATAGE